VDGIIAPNLPYVKFEVRILCLNVFK